MMKSGILNIKLKNNTNEIYIKCENLVNSNEIQNCTYKGNLLGGYYYYEKGIYNNSNIELAKVIGDINKIMLYIIYFEEGLYNKYNKCEKCPRPL